MLAVRHCKVRVFLVIDRIFIWAAHEKRNCHRYNFLQVMSEKNWMYGKLGQTCVFIKHNSGNMNSFNIRWLSNSNMGELELSIIHSQIQHGWTQVQIPCGWTLKFNMGELSIMYSQIQTWVNSSSNPTWMNSQIRTWVNLNSQLCTLEFNMGELKFKCHVDELSILTWVSSNSQLCTLKFNMGEFKFKFNMGWTQTLNYSLSNSTWGELKLSILCTHKFNMGELEFKFNMGVTTHLCTPLMT
jgi:hypothetical protein